MRTLGKTLVFGVAVAVAGAALSPLATGAAGQTKPDTAARMPDGKPNLNGIWQAMNTANWNLEDHPAQEGYPQLGAIGAIPPGQGVVEGGEIPYTPEAAKKRQENFKNRRTEDPEAKCYMPGVPRATYMPYPFQIIQGTSKIMIVYGFAEANRTIHMDKAKPEPAPIDSWMGRSHGRWDGDTLVVEVTGFNGQAWFDRAGNFASDALRVVERYTPVGHEPHPVRGHDRGQEHVHAALEDQPCRSTAGWRRTRRSSSSSASSSPRICSTATCARSRRPLRFSTLTWRRYLATLPHAGAGRGSVAAGVARNHRNLQVRRLRAPGVDAVGRLRVIARVVLVEVVTGREASVARLQS